MSESSLLARNLQSVDCRFLPNGYVFLLCQSSVQLVTDVSAVLSCLQDNSTYKSLQVSSHMCRQKLSYSLDSGDRLSCCANSVYHYLLNTKSW